MIRWPWRKHEIDERELERSRQALREANGKWASRTRRLSVASERAIIQNHFAHDFDQAVFKKEGGR